MTDDEDSDFWGENEEDEDDYDEHGRRRRLDHYSEGLAAAEARALEARFRKIGFHDAYDAAKEDRLQEGFEAGYKESFAISKEIGILLGRAVMNSQKERTKTTAHRDDGDVTATAANVVEQKMKLLIRERLTAPDIKTSDLQHLKKQMEAMNSA